MNIINLSPNIKQYYNWNQMMSLGSTLFYKLEDDRIRLEKVIQEQLEEPEPKTITPETKTITPEIKTITPEIKTITPELKTITPELKTITPEIKTPKTKAIKAEEPISFDLIDKKLLSNKDINEFSKELESKSVKLSNGTKPSIDIIKRYVRSIRFIIGTYKLLKNASAILRKTWKEIGIDINSPDVLKYLDSIDKGVNEIDNLKKFLDKNNMILNDKQNLVVITFLQLVLENFISLKTVKK
jgi:hypothetical protein